VRDGEAHTFFNSLFSDLRGSETFKPKWKNETANPNILASIENGGFL